MNEMWMVVLSFEIGENESVDERDGKRNTSKIENRIFYSTIGKKLNSSRNVELVCPT